MANALQSREDKTFLASSEKMTTPIEYQVIFDFMTSNANTAAELNSNSSQVQTYSPAANDEGPRIVVIGSGPAGVRFVTEILKRIPSARVSLLGNEPYDPYNRVQLSALLAGDINYEEITYPLPDPHLNPHFKYIKAHVNKIDTEDKVVYDAGQNAIPYDHLVIATGSRPHIPHIPGVNQTGVYTFRNLKDAESLYGRIARARHVVIVGGGLLGLEAARALQRANTLVTVIQQGPRLMNRQLDERAANYLQQKVEKLGVSVITNSGVRNILGEGRVTGVVTRDGDKVVCDTVLLCAGIKPVIELARNAKIKVTNGILVDDYLATSAEDVYAIGECCEHRGKTYGLVNPGFEQAAICADVIAKGKSHYVGSLEVSRLKVLGENVCSMGEVTEITPRPFLKEWTFENKKLGIYRKVVTIKGVLIGAVGFGDWPEIRRIQEAYQNQRKIHFWQILRFLGTGHIWGNSEDDNVALWPATTIVCQCNNISQGDLVAAKEQGASTVVALSTATSAGTVCGSCKPLLAKIVGVDAPIEKEKAWPTVLGASLVASLVALLIASIPGIAVSESVQTKPFFENIWNDHFWKQVTGFSILGLAVVGMALSLRKRFKLKKLGDFAYWRLAHVILGALCITTLVAHTGLHLGQQLNQWLMLNFLSVIIVGSLAGGAVALSHHLSANAAQRTRRFFTWAHIIVVWPLPILLTAHIISVYFF